MRNRVTSLQFTLLGTLAASYGNADCQGRMNLMNRKKVSTSIEVQEWSFHRHSRSFDRLPVLLLMMPVSFMALWLLIAVALYVFNRFVLQRGKTKLPLPPGPKGLLLVGNVKDLPPPGKQEYLHWLELKHAYGPISSLTVFGQTIVIIHDRNMAIELMDKRSSIHSGRPVMPFGNSCGWEDAMGAQQQGDPSFRGQRKHVFQQVGTKNSVAKYWPLQEGVVGRFLSRANKDNGQNLLKHVQT